MNINRNKIKYLLYARKSSENDEKQVQSIEDQEKVLREIAKLHNCTIVDVISESKSAKAPYMRPEFAKLVDRIKKGEAKGILAWKFDRISRNPVDTGTIQWLLQGEVIQSILTADREYLPEDNALLISVEGGMANQYIRDLSKNVKRGLNSKLEKGWMPSIAKMGYLNTKGAIRGENYIYTDTERFPLIRKAWDLMLTGNYSVQEILTRLNTEWGFRTRPTLKNGSKPMSRAGLYRIFTDQFYTGIFMYKGKLYQGKHEPMITMEEYETVQLLLRRKGQPRYHHHEYAYTGQVTCGECGGLISATFKEKIIKATGKRKCYTLYYCVNARKNAQNCSQGHYTNEEVLDAVIEEQLTKITITETFRDIALGLLNEQGGTETDIQERILEFQQKTLNITQRKLDNLIQLRLQELIDDEEYKDEKTHLKNEVTVIQAKMEETKKKTDDDWKKETKEAFQFAFQSHKEFLVGDAKVKKGIVAKASLNCTLKDKRLIFKGAEWIQAIEEVYPPVRAEFEAFELNKSPYFTGQKDLFDLFCPVVRALVDTIGTIFKNKPEEVARSDIIRMADIPP